VNACWFVFKWTIVLTFCAIVAGAVYLYFYVDDELRTYVEQTIGRHYTNYDVEVSGARLVKDRGIELRGLQITAPGDNEPLLVVDELFLACKTDLEELASGNPHIERITVRRPTLRATRDRAGQWNVAGLLPLPQLGDSSPPTVIEDATLIIKNESSSVSQPLVLQDGTFTVERKPAGPEQAMSTPGEAAERMVFHGQFGGRFVRQLNLSGHVEPLTGRLRCDGSIQSLVVSPELVAALSWGPVPLSAGTSIRGTVDGRFDVAYDPAVDAAPRFAAGLNIQQGRVEDARLPEVVTELTAGVRCTNQFLAIDDLSARCGDASLHLSGQRNGWGPASPATISFQIDRVRLARELFEKLPGRLADVWPKFQPTGQVSLNATATFDGQRWESDGVVEARQVDFAYEKYPYRLRQSTGTVTLKKDHLSIDLVAYAGDRPLTIRAELDNPGPAVLGWVEVKGQTVEIDEHVVSAIRKPKAREVVQSLHPAGRTDVYWKAWRNDPNLDKMSSYLRLDVREGAVCYDKFPYPVGGIRGRVEAGDWDWRIVDLSGATDTGRVTCNGHIRPAAAGGEVLLHFTGTDVPLEEELRRALPIKTQQVWDQLRPQGRIDVRESTVRYVPGQGPPTFFVRVEPHGDTASIMPMSFPVRFDQLRGVATYENGQVQIDNVQAQYGASPVSASGHCDTHPDGSWQLEIDKLSADQLTASRELLAAFPGPLRRVVSQLNPTGTINVDGALTLRGDADPRTPISSMWDLALYTYESDLNCGIALQHVRGGVRLTGDSDARRVRCRGELSVDSLGYLGNQVTQVSGPLYVESDQAPPGDQPTTGGTRVVLGTWATRQLGEPSRSIAGKLYGGDLTVDGQVVVNDIPQYFVPTTLRNAQLQRFANEAIPGSQKLRGDVSANVTFKGSGTDVNGMHGAGQVKLRNGHVYELPPIMALLNLLRGSLPDNAAFTSGDMQFRIEGQRVLVDQLELQGRAISLSGGGNVDFDWQADLAFNSLIGRTDPNLPIVRGVRKVLGQASGQFMKIRVTGDLRNPQITREALPIVNETIKQFQPGATDASDWSSIFTAPQRLLQLPSREGEERQ